MLEEEARKADIVLRKFLMIPKPHRIQVSTVLTDMYAFADCANADHIVAAEAPIQELAAHASDRPGYLIHTSGAGILLFADMDRQIFGRGICEIYDDWENVSEVTSIPGFAPHRRWIRLRSQQAAVMENQQLCARPRYTAEEVALIA